MSFKFSFFNSTFSSIAQKVELKNWDEFTKIMANMSNIKGHKPNKWEYIKQGMISSGIYGDNIKRGNKNVIGWQMVMLDIDNCLLSLDDIKKHFSLYNNIIYSSANCTTDKIKLRVIIELNSVAPSTVLSQIWSGCNTWCDSIVDPQTKDKSRLMYIPAKYDNNTNYKHIFLVNKGEKLDWKNLISLYPSIPEVDKYNKKNNINKLKHKIYLKNNKLPNFNIRNKDCRFCYKQMIDDYLLTPVGEHHLAIYKFMVKVCYQAQKIKYPLSIDELVDMAEQLDQLDGGFYDDKKLYNSGNDAMNYVGI